MTPALHEFRSTQTRIGRRSACRYPVIAGVEYKILGAVLKSGRGQTVNISSRGVLLQTRDTLLVGGRIVLSIAWPAQLDEKLTLTLRVFGSIVRVQGNLVAVKISRYEFRARWLQPAGGPIVTAVGVPYGHH